MKLTSAAVQKLFFECMFKEEELKEGQPTIPYLQIEAIRGSYGFHPERIVANRAAIKELLDELPEPFREGGGWSFLQACMDKHGEQWAEHENIEQLMVLGLATGWVSYVAPRAVWKVMPGGMPYFVIHPEVRSVTAMTTEEFRLRQRAAIEDASIPTAGDMPPEGSCGEGCGCKH